MGRYGKKAIEWLVGGKSFIRAKPSRLLVFVFALVFSVHGGRVLMQMLTHPPTTLGRLAYDVRRREDCLVYLKENGVYTPYLVLTSNYGGNALLLRKYLLDERRPFNYAGMPSARSLLPAIPYSGYYEDSDIDIFLNTEFFDTLDPLVQSAIVDSDIYIHEISGLGVSGRETFAILRKIFLLSVKELNKKKKKTRPYPNENVLRYFKDDYRRTIGTTTDGSIPNQWTRTSSSWETCSVTVIGEGLRGPSLASAWHGVRPAFCLPPSTPIVQRMVRGEEVFVLDLEGVE
jgi:hypothetical protein